VYIEQKWCKPSAGSYLKARDVHLFGRPPIHLPPKKRESRLTYCIWKTAIRFGQYVTISHLVAFR